MFEISKVSDIFKRHSTGVISLLNKLLLLIPEGNSGYEKKTIEKSETESERFESGRYPLFYVKIKNNGPDTLYVSTNYGEKVPVPSGEEIEFKPNARVIRRLGFSSDGVSDIEIFFLR